MPTAMDFTLGETQQAVARVAAEVLGPVPPTVPPAAGGEDGFDSALWKELGRAGCCRWPCRPGWAGTGSGCWTWRWR